MKKISERLEKLQEKERQLKEQKRKLLKQQSEKERKERTRRLIQKGALAEFYFNCETLTEEETTKLFFNISNFQDVKKLIEKSSVG